MRYSLTAESVTAKGLFFKEVYLITAGRDVSIVLEIRQNFSANRTRIWGFRPPDPPLRGGTPPNTVRLASD
jgi:hypothetical protein